MSSPPDPDRSVGAVVLPRSTESEAMTGVRKLYTHGNSVVMSLDRETRRKLGVDAGTKVMTEVTDGKLIVEPAPEVVQDE